MCNRNAFENGLAQTEWGATLTLWLSMLRVCVCVFVYPCVFFLFSFARSKKGNPLGLQTLCVPAG